MSEQMDEGLTNEQLLAQDAQMGRNITWILAGVFAFNIVIGIGTVVWTVWSVS